MTAFPHGLYESLVTEALAARLDELPADRRARTDALRAAEAADRIAWHIASVVERAVEMLPESQRTEAGVELARSLVDRVVEGTAVAELDDRVYRADDEIDVTVRYSPRVARRLIERGGGEVQDDGSVRVTQTVADTGWIVRHVLQYGPDAVVVGPVVEMGWGKR